MSLTSHQRQALDDYEALVVQHAHLVAARHARPIIIDPATLERYAAEHDVVLGVCTRNPYLLFVNDLVATRQADGTTRTHPYLRILSRAQLTGGAGVVVLGTVENAELGPVGSVVVVEIERHALGTVEMELPRGFAEVGRSQADQALREIAEEAGFEGDSAQYLGRTATDSGLLNNLVSFYHVPLLRRVAMAEQSQEAIQGVHLLPRAAIWHRVDTGLIRDGFTVQALGLYERHLERIR